MEDTQEKAKTICQTPGKKKEIDYLDMQIRKK